MAGNFLCRFLLQCCQSEQHNPSGDGNLCGQFSMAGVQANLQIVEVPEDETEGSETSIHGSSENTSFELELERHLYGMFSMAGVGPPTNFPNKDRSQLVSGTLTEQEGGPRGVFVGIYDGHGGTTCSQFLLDHLFQNFKSEELFNLFSFFSNFQLF